jgi:hypothetical protein
MSRWLDLEKVKPASLREIAYFVSDVFDPDVVIQALLAVLSLVAIAMIATTGPWHRWGFIVGLISQPFWIAATWRARTPAGDRSWGMFVLSCCYVFVWILGIGERFPNLLP